MTSGPTVDQVEAGRRSHPDRLWPRVSGATYLGPVVLVFASTLAFATRLGAIDPSRVQIRRSARCPSDERYEDEHKSVSLNAASGLLTKRSVRGVSASRRTVEVQMDLHLGSQC